LTVTSHTIMIGDITPMKSSKSEGASQVREAAAARKRIERDRRREAGFVPREIWVRPADWPRVEKYLLRINKKAGQSVE
jgi:hypothetical protein